jgi:hypothetical protein
LVVVEEVVAALLSANCAAGGGAGVGEVVEGDWASANGKKPSSVAAAKARRFMVVESLSGCRKIKAAVYIDKDAARTASVNRT